MKAPRVVRVALTEREAQIATDALLRAYKDGAGNIPWPELDVLRTAHNAIADARHRAQERAWIEKHGR